MVTEFVAAQSDRLLTEYSPSYAPELNPIEYLWGYGKHHELPNFGLDEPDELGFFDRQGAVAHATPLRTRILVLEASAPATIIYKPQ